MQLILDHVPLKKIKMLLGLATMRYGGDEDKYYTDEERDNLCIWAIEKQKPQAMCVRFVL